MNPNVPQVKTGITTIIVVLLIALKLDGIIALSWCWILIPWVIINFIRWIIDAIDVIIYRFK